MVEVWSYFCCRTLDELDINMVVAEWHIHKRALAQFYRSLKWLPGRSGCISVNDDMCWYVQLSPQCIVAQPVNISSQHSYCYCRTRPVFISWLLPLLRSGYFIDCHVICGKIFQLTRPGSSRSCVLHQSWIYINVTTNNCYLITVGFPTGNNWSNLYLLDISWSLWSLETLHQLQSYLG
jgi:hypothetical protein